MLEQEKIARLEALGVSWSPFAEQWASKFAELTHFKERNGHCNVSSRTGEDRALGTWVSNQRRAYKKGMLEQEKIARLEALGVLWEVYGHCKVSKKGEERQLGIWVGKQRAAYKKGILSQDKIVRLEAIGII